MDFISTLHPWNVFRSISVGQPPNSYFGKRLNLSPNTYSSSFLCKSGGPSLLGGPIVLPRGGLCRWHWWERGVFLWGHRKCVVWYVYKYSNGAKLHTLKRLLWSTALLCSCPQNYFPSKTWFRNGRGWCTSPFPFRSRLVKQLLTRAQLLRLAVVGEVWANCFRDCSQVIKTCFASYPSGLIWVCVESYGGQLMGFL